MVGSMQFHPGAVKNPRSFPFASMSDLSCDFSCWTCWICWHCWICCSTYPAYPTAPTNIRLILSIPLSLKSCYTIKKARSGSKSISPPMVTGSMIPQTGSTSEQSASTRPASSTMISTSIISDDFSEAPKQTNSPDAKRQGYCYPRRQLSPRRGVSLVSS